MQKTITDNLIKSSAVIAISNKISLLQRKIFNFLIAHAYGDLETKESYHIDIRHLTQIIGFNSKNISYLKESLRQLMATVVEFNLLGKDKESWSATTLLSSVEFYEWQCTYAFSPVLRKKLHQPNIYAKIKLSMMKLFSSKYALCLYEVFIDYHNIWQTPIIPLHDFRKLMGIEAHQYTEFKRLSLRVIKPALKELSAIGWYKVEVAYKRENRKVVALKFYFKATQTQKKAIEETKIIKHQDLQNRLIKDFWLSLRQAHKTIMIYPIPYIKESLAIIKIKIAQKVVKNIPAYTVTVLKNDYTSLPHTQKEPILWSTLWSSCKEVTIKGSMENSKNKTMNGLLCSASDNHIRQTQKKAQLYFDSLSKVKQQTLVKKFEDEKITSDILKTLYGKEWIEGTIFKVMFENYISSKNSLKKRSLQQNCLISLPSIF